MIRRPAARAGEPSHGRHGIPPGETPGQSRVDDQIAWYDKKSVASQRWAWRLRVAELSLASLLPFLAGFSAQCKALPYVIGFIGVTLAIITGVLGFTRFEKTWVAYRTTCEALRRERLLFLTATAPYDTDSHAGLALLVRRVETLLAAENGEWARCAVAPKAGSPAGGANEPPAPVTTPASHGGD